MAIWRGVGGSGESTNDSTVPTVTALLVDAEAARDAAQLAETNAETAATNAASSASTASTQASNAATSATNAASSASSASTSATNAASSASTASTQASNAASSASAASTSATNAASSASSAASSASTATTKASEASTSATNAASSATAAAASASSAATQASNAASSASAASTSASNAATSESNAASSASAAAASYDSFDDRYLGAKSSAPTLDNDGNALLTGALYFNTSTNEMKVWSGSAWLNAYASLSGALLATNNLSDLNNVATARTNLGLGTAATQNSTAFATAAQGTNADTAYGWGNHALAGYAADSAVVKLTGDQTIAGTKTFSSNPILSAGTANGVVYLNGSKVATSGSALTFDGTNLGVNSSSTIDGGRFNVAFAGNTQNGIGLKDTADASGASFWGAYNSTGGFIGSLRRNGTDNALAINGNSYLAFQQNSTEQMRLTSTGLGIGTSSPSEKLTVNGNIKLGTSGTTWIYGPATTGRSIYSNSDSTAYIIAYGSAYGGSNDAGLQFTAGTTNTMVFNASGNLGLGVTPSAWSGQTALQTNGGSLATSNTATLNLTQNAYYNGTSWIRTNALAASMLQQSGGAFNFFTAGSSTAGSAITFTQAMTLDASGNLGIGTTSPVFSAGSGVHLQRAGVATYRTYNSSSTAAGEFRADATGTAIDCRGLEVFRVLTGGSERARIDSSGQMIIGATDVGRGDKLTVVGAGTLSTVTSSVRGLLAVESNSSTAQNVGGAISLGGNYDAGRTQFAAIGGYKESATSSDYAGYLAFFTRPSGDLTKERARITSGGDLLVGATSSAANSGTGVKLLPSGYVYVVAPSTTSDTYNYYNSTAGAYRFYVTNAGVINATSTTITAISDQRLKENIQDIDVGLDAVMALKPRKFDWKAGKGKDKKGDRGWIAQEFEQVFPDMITTWKDEPPEGEEPYKAVNADLIPVLVKAIQELKAEVDSLKAQLNKGA